MQIIPVTTLEQAERLFKSKEPILLVSFDPFNFSPKEIEGWTAYFGSVVCVTEESFLFQRRYEESKEEMVISERQAITKRTSDGWEDDDGSSVAVFSLIS